MWVRNKAVVASFKSIDDNITLNLKGVIIHCKTIREAIFILKIAG